MAYYHPNSEWRRRADHLRTDREKLEQVARDKQNLLRLVLRYRAACCGYAMHMLQREKQAQDDSAAEKVDAIWSKMMEMLPTKLASRWISEGRPFRDVLLEAIHEAYFACLVRGNSQSPPVPDALAFHQQMRPQLLEESWKAVRECERRGAGGRPYTILRLSADHPEDDDESLRLRFASLSGGQLLEPAAFRKRLSRARHLFHRALRAEVEACITRGGVKPCDQEVQDFLDMLDLGERA